MAAEHLRRQAAWCYRLGSPLYGRLLEEATRDCEAGGATWQILEGYEGGSRSSALALRFLGAVHRVVLEGLVPYLQRHYASAGGAVCGEEEAWEDFRRALVSNRERIRDLVCRPVQTNEVGRCAALLGGFLMVAEMMELPLRLFEIGASAGLNLRWDCYRYEGLGMGWGDASSPVRFEDIFEGAPPTLDGQVSIVERAGCDTNPIDPCSEEGRLTLMSYVWPDQRERVVRLAGALEVAGRVPAPVERADAASWIAKKLTSPCLGVTTVVFHSIVMQYLGHKGAREVTDLIEAAGRRATASAPFAWLRLEPRKGADGEWQYGVDLTTWPGGEARLLAFTSPHGPPVRWLAD
ncbi:MAG: DUF2332 domain-containing protein [Candidatus Binatia bacterium]